MPLTPEEQSELQINTLLIAASLKDADPLFTFEPLPQQSLILNSQTPVTVAFGGNRAGKSDIGAAKTIIDWLKVPNRKIWCCTVDEALAIRVQMKKIHDLLPKALKTKGPNSPRNFYYNYTSSGGYVNCKFTLNNNTSCEFKFYSQEVKSFQGEDLDGIWFDETPPKPHYDESTVRLWDRGGKVLITCTSTEGVTPWVRQLLSHVETKLTRYAPLVRKHLPVHQFSRTFNANIFYLWTTDNPHIDQNAVQAKARLYSSSELELRIYGVPSNLQGLIYTSFSQAIHVRPTPTLPSPPRAIPLQIIDPHDRKPWCMGWYTYVPQTQTLYVLEEYPDSPLHEDDSASHLAISDYVRFIKIIENKLRYAGWQPHHHIYRLIDPNKGLTPVVGDTITETIVQNLARKQLFYTPAPDALLEGHIEVREHLAYDPSEQISDTNQPRLFISPQCQNHIYQMANYEFSDHRSEAAQEEKGPKETPKAKHKDFPDLIRYAVLFLKKFGQQVSTVETSNRNKSRRRSYV